MLPNLGPAEMLVVLTVAVLLFGKRLPEVGRSLGKGLVEFKKGIRGIEDEVESPGTAAPRHPEASLASPTVPKFEPPHTAPAIQASADSQTLPD